MSKQSRSWSLIRQGQQIRFDPLRELFPQRPVWVGDRFISADKVEGLYRYYALSKDFARVGKGEKADIYAGETLRDLDGNPVRAIRKTADTHQYYHTVKGLKERPGLTVPQAQTAKQADAGKQSAAKSAPSPGSGTTKTTTEKTAAQTPTSHHPGAPQPTFDVTPLPWNQDSEQPLLSGLFSLARWYQGQKRFERYLTALYKKDYESAFDLHKQIASIDNRSLPIPQNLADYLNEHNQKAYVRKVHEDNLRAQGGAAEAAGAVKAVKKYDGPVLMAPSAHPQRLPLAKQLGIWWYFLTHPSKPTGYEDIAEANPYILGFGQPNMRLDNGRLIEPWKAITFAAIRGTEQMKLNMENGPVGRVIDKLVSAGSDISPEQAHANALASSNREIQKYPQSNSKVFNVLIEDPIESTVAQVPEVATEVLATLATGGLSVPMAAVMKARHGAKAVMAMAKAKRYAPTVIRVIMDGMGSANSEYISTVMNELTNRGVDITDPEALKKAFEDTELMSVVQGVAWRKAAVVGSVDALLSNLPGKQKNNVWAEIRQMLIKPSTRAIGNVMKSVGKEKAIQAGGSAVGEAASQVAAKGKIYEPQEIIEEFVSELLPDAKGLLSNGLTNFSNPSSQQEGSTELSTANSITHSAQNPNSSLNNQMTPSNSDNRQTNKVATTNNDSKQQKIDTATPVTGVSSANSPAKLPSPASNGNSTGEMPAVGDTVLWTDAAGPHLGPVVAVDEAGVMVQHQGATKALPHAQVERVTPGEDLVPAMPKVAVPRVTLSAVPQARAEVMDTPQVRLLAPTVPMFRPEPVGLTPDTSSSPPFSFRIGNMVAWKTGAGWNVGTVVRTTHKGDLRVKHGKAKNTVLVKRKNAHILSPFRPEPHPKKAQ